MSKKGKRKRGGQIKTTIDRSAVVTSMSAWKARARGLNHTEQTINTEATPIRNTKGHAPSDVSYREMNQRYNKLLMSLMNCNHRIPAEKVFPAPRNRSINASQSTLQYLVHEVPHFSLLRPICKLCNILFENNLVLIIKRIL